MFCMRVAAAPCLFIMHMLYCLPLRYLEKYIKPKVAPLLISGKLKSGDRAVLARSNTNPNQLNLIVSVS